MPLNQWCVGIPGSCYRDSVWACLVCQTRVRLAFLRWHRLAHCPHQHDAHMRPKAVISVVPPTPYFSLTYGRYYIACQVEEPSGSTIKAMHLWGNNRGSFKRYCSKQLFLSVGLLNTSLINQIIVWSIKHPKMMKSDYVSWSQFSTAQPHNLTQLFMF